MFFHEYFSDFDGDFGVFDENDTYNSVPNKHPPFSLFFKAPGAIKGAKTVNNFISVFPIQMYR